MMNLCHLSFLIFYLLSSNFWYVEGYGSPTPNPETESVTEGNNIPFEKKETIKPMDIKDLMNTNLFPNGDNPLTDKNDQAVEETPTFGIQPANGGIGGEFRRSGCIRREGGRERNGLGFYSGGRTVGGRRFGVGGRGRRNRRGEDGSSRPRPDSPSPATGGRGQTNGRDGQVGDGSSRPNPGTGGGGLPLRPSPGTGGGRPLRPNPYRSWQGGSWRGGPAGR